MASSGKVIGWGLALFGAYWLYQKYITASALEFSFGSVSWNGLSIGQPISGTANFNVNNPTNNSLIVNGLDGVITLQNDGSGNLASNISSTEQVTIAPNSSMSYPIAFSIPAAALISDLDSIFSSGTITGTVNFTGTVTIEGAGIPINSTVQA
jgi:hypothetical protein